MRFNRVFTGVSFALLAGAAMAAPAPQYTVQDLQQSFSQPPAAAAAPEAGSPAAGGAAPGSCEAAGMASGPDGTCVRRKPGTRGFNLVGSQGAASEAAKPASRPAASASASRPTASRPAAPAPVRSRDLLISFDNNSAVLTEQAKVNARVFAQALSTPALQGARFEIDGHTNAVGSRDLNRKLSRARAQALVSFLAAEGVDRSRLVAQGYGSDRLLNSADPTASENRRVEARRLQ